LPNKFNVSESRDNSIPRTLLDWRASALLLILSAAFLHSIEVSEAAKASLRLLLPVNAGPMRSIDATTTAAATVVLPSVRLFS